MTDPTESARLRDLVRAALPGKSLELMNEIEAFAGMAIRFGHYPYPPPPNSIVKNQAAAELSHDEATIYLQNFDDVDPHAITHELLHIRRNWLEGVPQLHPIKGKDTPQARTVCGNVDNEIEHLVIVPQEASFGFDSSSFWNAVAKAKWDRYPWPDIADADGRRGNALLGRLSLQLVTDPKVHARAAECLKAEGLIFEGDKFAARINQFLQDKPRALSCAVCFLRWPRASIQLVYFDVRARSRRVAPISAH